MEDLEDELDLRYHKGINPDVYYRCPTLESLEGALRNEIEKNASSLIPTDVVTEFIFAAASTLTIPVAFQQNLSAIIEPAEFLQSITVEYALCRDIDGKDRLKAQRAIAKSIIEAIQAVDGFKYSERSAQNKEGGDGARLKYVCQDSLQNRDRKSNMKKEKSQESGDSEHKTTKKIQSTLPTYDCGGAIHVKFSLKREAINVVYKHNPIHGPTANGDSLPGLAIEDSGTLQPLAPDATNGKKPRKRKRSKKDEVQVEDDIRDPDLDMSTSPEAPKSSTKKKRKKTNALTSPETGRKTTIKTTKKSKQSDSPINPRKKASVAEPSPPPKPIKGRACIRCREKKIKCNEGKPTCNQCQRGLWSCQYEVLGTKKRSKNGCLNCKRRKRKCTEERPSCAHCLRLDDDCEYADDHIDF